MRLAKANLCDLKQEFRYACCPGAPGQYVRYCSASMGDMIKDYTICFYNSDMAACQAKRHADIAAGSGACQPYSALNQTSGKLGDHPTFYTTFSSLKGIIGVIAKVRPAVFVSRQVSGFLSRIWK